MGSRHSNEAAPNSDALAVLATLHDSGLKVERARILRPVTQSHVPRQSE